MYRLATSSGGLTSSICRDKIAIQALRRHSMKNNSLRLLAAFLALAVSGMHAQHTASAPSAAPAQGVPASAHQAAHWTYEGEEGPGQWGELDEAYATCKLGHEQSPIDIHNAQVSTLDPIQFDYHASPLRVLDNGHTIVVNYAPGSSITVGGHRYELKQFHFHHPSEEKIDGKGFQLVIHLVHADAEGKLAVVGILLDPGPAQATVQTIWNHIPKEKKVDTAVADVTVNAGDLLPAGRGYYTFMGSLTTPPCSEHVTWFVLKYPGSVSAAQVEAFSAIYPLNARPTQPVGDRVIRVSK
jgi:carbonic anhydrase